jgi:hypothetical protein
MESAWLKSRLQEQQNKVAKLKKQSKKDQQRLDTKD